MCKYFLIILQLISKIQWTPEGKRLITGASTGEFTLWNGTAFNFETILQVNLYEIDCKIETYSRHMIQQFEHYVGHTMINGWCQLIMTVLSNIGNRI